MRHVEIYTDGSCLGNPGKGGWGCVLIDSITNTRRELWGSENVTTNNRMEVTAAIRALEALKYPCAVSLTSDSRYLINAISKGWAAKWKEKGWMLDKKNPAKNPDLFDRLLVLCDIHEVEFLWVKGHNGHVENERCDFLAQSAAQSK